MSMAPQTPPASSLAPPPPRCWPAPRVSLLLMPRAALCSGGSYEFVEDEESKAALYKYGNGTYKSEEAVAFVLSYAKQIAEKHAGSVIKDCVITVPPYYRHEAPPPAAPRPPPPLGLAAPSAPPLVHRPPALERPPAREARVTAKRAASRWQERNAMLAAAQIAGLNVLSLMHDNTAFAFKYGFDKEAEFAKEPTNVVFYDLGASSYKARHAGA